MTGEPCPTDAKDKTLFTPGPLTTSRTVKQAMLRDLGSRDAGFIRIVDDVRRSLLAVAGVSRDDGYEAVLMQGSGTFGIEAVVGSTVPPDGKLLVIVNGAYGQRIARIAQVLNIETVILEYPENATPVPSEIDHTLSGASTITNVAVVHCETTTGILNPIDEIGRVVKGHGKTYFVDSMSAFGAVKINLTSGGIDYLVSSANKCLEGVPGFSFAICRRDALQVTKDWARSLSLDLWAQWQGLESNGQFRFTPPTHAILALEQALCELNAEGGVEGRAARYEQNHRCLVEGMRSMGFREYLEPADEGHIITSFHYPKHPNFRFEEFYDRLNNRGMVIYPGKVSDAECFRIGTIGHLFVTDIRDLLAAIQDTLAQMKVCIGRE
jgi:2-aminoethylphosphonate-pyruvate transaminase